MDPALALPSYRVYRGSLLALLVGSIVAVWLLILPPASADQDGPPESIAGLVNEPTVTATATAEASGTAEGEGGTPGSEAPEGTGEAEGGEDASPTPPPEGTEPPESTPTGTPEPQEQTYIVQSGDTLLIIAQQFAPAGTDPTTFANTIAAANGITDPSSLQVGQELTIPAQ